MEHSMPTRIDLIDTLQRLYAGRASRVEIAEWATSIIDDDSLRITDRLVWDMLKKLGAVDLPAPDRDFLYTGIDFEEWLSELH